MAKGRRNKKSGNTMLRMDPALHARAEKTAEALGMSLNGMLNYLIYQHLPHYEGLVVLTDDARTPALYARWLQLNPRGDFPLFARDLAILLPHGFNTEERETLRFEDGNYYQVNAAFDGFCHPPSSTLETLRKADFNNAYAKALELLRAVIRAEEKPTAKAQGETDETK